MVMVLVAPAVDGAGIFCRPLTVFKGGPPFHMISDMGTTVLPGIGTPPLNRQRSSKSETGAAICNWWLTRRRRRRRRRRAVWMKGERWIRLEFASARNIV